MAEEIINGGEVDTAEVEVGTENTEQETFTRDEVMKLIQAEADRRVSQAMATAQKKHEKDLARSKMDAETKANAEKDDLIAELQEKVKIAQAEKIRSDLKSLLSASNVSAELADLIAVNDDEDASVENANKLIKFYKASVSAEVERRLAGSVPKGNNGTNDGMTKEEFNKLSLAEQQNLITKNPELYKKFL